MHTQKAHKQVKFSGAKSCPLLFRGKSGQCLNKNDTDSFPGIFQDSVI